MKKAFISIMILVLFNNYLLCAKKNILSDENITRFEGKYAPGKFAVIKIDGIPAGAIGTSAKVSISVKKDGSWDFNLFGNSVNAYLQKGDILEIYKCDATGKSISIQMETKKGHQIGEVEKLCLTKIKFLVFEDDSFESADTRIARYLDVYDSQEEIGKGNTKELEIGMSSEDVIKILGEPSKKAKLGAKTIFKYDDMIVTLQNDKVVNIEFN